MRLDGYSIAPLEWDLCWSESGICKYTFVVPLNSTKFRAIASYGDDEGETLGDFDTRAEAREACWQHHCAAVLALLIKEATDAP